jgi:alanyl-tRNA synthetase
VVRMLTMTSDSVELCGGTHARTLGEIGLFKITSEQGLAAGVRRIEAVTGLNALGYVRSVEAALRSAARSVKGSPADLTEKVEKLVERERRLEREVADLNRKVALGAGSSSGGPDEMLKQARDIPGGKALAVRLSAVDAGTLRETAEKLRDSLGPSIVLVGAASKDKAMLVLMVSKTMTSRYSAGDLIKPIAEIVGGSGGGRPDMAQAGGAQVARLDEALGSLYGRLV